MPATPRPRRELALALGLAALLLLASAELRAQSDAGSSGGGDGGGGGDAGAQGEPSEEAGMDEEQLLEAVVVRGPWDRWWERHEQEFGLALPRIVDGGAGLATGARPEPWELWWNRYRDEFLWGDEPWSLDHGRLSTWRPPPRRGPVTPGEPRRLALVRERPAILRRGFVYGRVVPGLRELAEHRDARIRGAALAALGNAVEARFAAAVADTLREALDDPSLGVRRAALVAMGRAYDPEFGPELLAIARDEWPGRTLIRDDRVPEQLSVGALLALGFAGDERLVPELRAFFEKLPENEVRQRGALIAALGLGSGQRAPQVAEWLHPRLEDYWLDERVRESIPGALAQLGVNASVPVLLDMLADRDLDPRLRSSCVFALGGSARPDDDAAVALLLDRAFTDKDMETRRAALMGVFRMLARDREPHAHYLNHARATQALAAQIEDPRHRNDLSWHALAAGLYLRAHPEFAPNLRRRLEDGVIDNKDPQHRGAWALALGLARTEGYGEELLELFLDEPQIRRHTALALGFHGYRPAVAELYEVLTSEAHAPFEEIGLALMMLDDARAPGVLLAMLAEAGNLHERVALTMALAHHRTEPVAARLLELARDEHLDELTRVEVINALGRVCTSRQLPWDVAYELDSPAGRREHASPPAD